MSINTYPFTRFRSIFGKRIAASKTGLLLLQPATNEGAGEQIVIGQSRVTTITSAQLLALNATPQIIIPAPDAGYANILTGLAVRKPAGTAYAGVGATEDLVAKYTDGSGQEVSGQIETAGFLDQTTAQLRYVGPVGAAAAVADITPLSAAAIVLALNAGEVTTGTGGLVVKAFWTTIKTTFAA